MINNKKLAKIGHHNNYAIKINYIQDAIPNVIYDAIPNVPHTVWDRHQLITLHATKVNHRVKIVSYVDL